MTENNTHKDIMILFREQDQKHDKLQPGTMTMKELYNSEPFVWVKNICGDQRYVSRRDFHVIDESPEQKPEAVVCDIDGVLNFIPEHYHGTTHRDRILLENGESVQWTQLNLSATAKHNLTMFTLLASFSDQGFDILMLTARGDTQRIQTERWLREGFRKINRPDIRYSVFMRGWSANDLAAPAMKAQMMQSCILPNYDVEYFIEDCSKNCLAMRNACPDVPIMQIHG